MNRLAKFAATLLLVSVVTGCASDEDPALDGEHDSLADGAGDAWGIASDSYLADAVVRFASAASYDQLLAVQVHPRAARGVVAAARPFASLSALDAVAYTGEVFFSRLVTAVSDADLVGSCGDGQVQPIAGETCDGTTDCASDCRASVTMAALVATPNPVVEVLDLGADRIAVTTGYSTCDLHVFQGTTRVRTFSNTGCTRLVRWVTPSGAINPAIRSDASSYQVLELDAATGARRTHWGTFGAALWWLDDDTSLSYDNTWGVRFVDRTSGEVIARHASAVILGVETDRGVIADNRATGQLERLTMDENDTLTIEPIAPTTEVRFSPEGRHHVQLVAGKVEFSYYPAGATEPSEVHEVGPLPTAYPGVNFVASNGWYVTRTSDLKAHVVADQGGGRVAVTPCGSRDPVRTVETATALILQPPYDCFDDRGRRAIGFYRVAKP